MPQQQRDDVRTRGAQGDAHTNFVRASADAVRDHACHSTDGQEHRFDWCYHNRGTSATAELAGLKDTPAPGDEPGMEFIRNLKSGATDAPIHVTFPDEKVTTELRLDAQPGSTLWTGDGVGDSVDQRVPLAMVTRMALTEKDGALTIVVEHGTDLDEVVVTGKKVELKRAGKRVLAAE